MKRIITICAAILMTANVFAQVPNKMSYQAVIRNTSNTLVTSSTVGMRISILQTSPSGTAIFVETQTSTTNTNGLVSIEIGGGTVVSGNFATIDWANGPYFLKTETDPSGGSSYSITGTSQLLSVPYALYAANSGSSMSGPQGAAGPQGATGPQGPAGVGGFVHYIGEVFGGGVIFHLWKDNSGAEHGLVVDLNDLSGASGWSNVDNTLIGLSAQSYWNGLGNSNSIVSQIGHTSSAAVLCLNSTSSGQSDWYLPSIQELNMLWNNYFNVSMTFSQIPGTTQMDPSGYWSSTEYDINSAWGMAFDSGTTYANSSYNKNTIKRVRAVRTF
jgi:hypothetical protein